MNESQLSDYLHDLDQPVPPVDWAGAAIATGRRQQRRRTALVAAAGMATSALAIVAVVSLRPDGTQTIRSGTAPAPAGSDFRAVASQELQQIRRGDCAPTAASFDPLVATALNAPRLCAAYAAYTEQFGQLVRADPPRVTKKGRLTVIQIDLVLEHARGEYRVTFHPDGKIAGIYFLRAGVPL